MNKPKNVTILALKSGLVEHKCPKCRQKAGVQVFYWGENTFVAAYDCEKHGKIKEDFMAYA